MRDLRYFYAFRAIFSGYIAYSSIATAVQAGTVKNPVFWLAAVETAAVLLLLVPATELAAAFLLSGVFGFAFVAEALGGNVPLRFIYFTASAWMIVYLNRSVRPRLGGC